MPPHCAVILKINKEKMNKLALPVLASQLPPAAKRKALQQLAARQCDPGPALSIVQQAAQSLLNPPAQNSSVCQTRKKKKFEELYKNLHFRLLTQGVLLCGRRMGDKEGGEQCVDCRAFLFRE